MLEQIWSVCLWALALSCSLLFRGCPVVCEVRLFSQLIVKSQHTHCIPQVDCSQCHWIEKHDKHYGTYSVESNHLFNFMHIYVPGVEFYWNIFQKFFFWCYMKVMSLIYLFLSIFLLLFIMCRTYYFSLLADLDFQSETMKIYYKDMHYCKFKIMMTIIWDIGGHGYVVEITYRNMEDTFMWCVYVYCWTLLLDKSACDLREFLFYSLGSKSPHINLNIWDIQAVYFWLNCSPNAAQTDLFSCNILEGVLISWLTSNFLDIFLGFYTFILAGQYETDRTGSNARGKSGTG